MTYTSILVLSSALYLLRSIIQLLNRRRYIADVSPQTGMTLRNLLRIAIIASLMVLERIVYRQAYSFALGLELTLLKVLFALVCPSYSRRRYRLHIYFYPYGELTDWPLIPCQRLEL
jgi:hypothetical protein